MAGMAAVAVLSMRHELPGYLAVGLKKGPAALEARGVFDVGLDAHHLAVLVISVLVDRTLAACAAHFQNQYGLVWPGAGMQKGFVRQGLGKHVVEHMVTRCGYGAVTHIKSRAQVNPFPVVSRQYQLILVI